MSDTVERLRGKYCCDAANCNCDAAEIERLRAALSELGVTPEEARAGAARSKAIREERDALRAKIKQMEKQEPVGEIRRANSTGNYINPVVWVPMAVGAKLYAGPGAKGEEK